MTAVFLRLLNISITAGWIVLVVVLLRFVLKKAPKWIRCALWALVALRLLLPVSIESELSLIPSAETVQVQSLPTVPDQTVSEPAQSSTDRERIVIQSGFSALNSAVNPPVQEAEKHVDTVAALKSVAGYVWIGGVAAMLLYAVISYLRLRRAVRASIETEKGVFVCDEIGDPFILGMIRPRIYLPSGMDADAQLYVLLHERAHLKRFDHLWKPFAFLLLSVYWFHPLIWLSYILLCRDVELACDEKVVRAMNAEGKAAYSDVLLTCSRARRAIAACPLAFGEVGVKTRVKSILNYKKPAFWIILVAILLFIGVAVCFLTVPKKSKDPAPSPETVTFTAILQGSSDGSFLIEPTESAERERAAAERFLIPITHIETSREPQLGDLLEITYNGEILKDADPVQLGEILLIRVIRVQCWFDYYQSPETMPEKPLETSFDAFPGVTFRWTTSGSVEAEENGEKTVLCSGTVRSVYFADVTGDGIFDLCFTADFGSGIAGARVIVYDYANRQRYVLEEEGAFDYHLYMDNGELFVGKTPYMDDKQIESGRLTMLDGTPVYHSEHAGSMIVPLKREPLEDEMQGTDVLSSLRRQVPQYFNLPTQNGLDVYVWQMSESAYSCGLLPGTTRARVDTELWNLTGVDIETMRLILSDYGLPDEDIRVHAFQHPISSYAYTIDAVYKKQVTALIKDEPRDICSIVYDIDGDGKLETCKLSYGPTSGLFTVVFSASRNGTVVYKNTFNLDAGELELSVREADGALTVRHIHQIGIDSESTTATYGVSVENGRIVLSGSPDDFIYYWGLADPDWNIH